MRATGCMHSATLAGSRQLRRLLGFLEAAGARGATAMEIRVGLPGEDGVEAVSAAISALRDNGIDIPKSVPEPRGGRRKQYVYRLGKFASGTPSEALLDPVQRSLFGEVG